MSTYTFVEGARLKGDAQAAGETLEHLRTNHGGLLTAELVVEQARQQSSPLHGYFEWDDTEAAHQYRLEQARHLIRHIVVREAETAAPRKAYVQVQVKDVRAYTDTVEALQDEGLRLYVLNQAKRDLESFARRYGELEELAGMLPVVHKTIQTLSDAVAVNG